MGGYGILSYFNISINKPFFFSSLGQTNQPSCYASLNEEETQNIRAILFIMDRFSISLEGYHELAQVEKSLPRTHLIEKYAKTLDSHWDIRRTPGAGEGAELPFQLLLQHEIQKQVSSCNNLKQYIILLSFLLSSSVLLSYCISN